jgi:uncharacterized membrane protein
MRTATRPPRQTGLYLVRIVAARPRMFIAALVGLVVPAVLPARWQIATKALVGWDVGIALYLVLVYELMARTPVDAIRHHAAIEDEGQLGILVLSVAAALASLGAIVVKLGTSTADFSGRQPAELVLATLTILLSWAFIHTIFALHYAHQFYGETGEGAGGLVFPGDDPPDYWDFVYFSFVIGMTSQVSDVGVRGKPIRRTVTAHGILSFVFNTALLALTINIAASAI